MEQKFKEIIGGNIATLLAAKGMTQSELAERMGVSSSAVSQLVRGAHTPSVDTVKRVADILHVPLWELLDTHDVNEYADFVGQQIQKIAEKCEPLYLLQMMQQACGEIQTAAANAMRNVEGCREMLKAIGKLRVYTDAYECQSAYFLGNYRGLYRYRATAAGRALYEIERK